MLLHKILISISYHILSKSTSNVKYYIPRSFLFFFLNSFERFFSEITQKSTTYWMQLEIQNCVIVCHVFIKRNIFSIAKRHAQFSGFFYIYQSNLFSRIKIMNQMSADQLKFYVEVILLHKDNATILIEFTSWINRRMY